VRQWRAQSLHQLQELERMNQALRSALSQYIALPSSTSGMQCAFICKQTCGGLCVYDTVWMYEIWYLCMHECMQVGMCLCMWVSVYVIVVCKVAYVNVCLGGLSLFYVWTHL
jgi:hypothetical protein